MKISSQGDAVIEQFRSLPLAERKAVMSAIGHVGVPDAHRGFFVDAAKPEEEQRAEILFELEGLINAQSTGFMVEMIPLMYPFFQQMRGRGRYLEALDVGPRTAAGTALLADLFMSHHSRLPTWFDTIDIDPTFCEYQQTRWPRLRQSLVGDIFDLPPAAYDYVVCSHTIEHLDDPAPFCRQLQRMARDYVFVACPFEEQVPIFGHRRVTDSFVDSLAPLYKRVLKSWWWEARDGNEDVIFFVLPGDPGEPAQAMREPIGAI